MAVRGAKLEALRLLLAAISCGISCGIIHINTYIYKSAAIQSFKPRPKEGHAGGYRQRRIYSRSNLDASLVGTKLQPHMHDGDLHANTQAPSTNCRAFRRTLPNESSAQWAGDISLRVQTASSEHLAGIPENAHSE